MVSRRCPLQNQSIEKKAAFRKPTGRRWSAFALTGTGFLPISRRRRLPPDVSPAVEGMNVKVFR